MKLAVIGSRVPDEWLSDALLPYIPTDVTELVSGGAVGVDTAAEQIARWLSLPLRVFLPDYKRYGTRAPLVRNAELIAYADEALAFWDGSSPGTMHTIQECLQSGKAVRIVSLASKNPQKGETPTL